MFSNLNASAFITPPAAEVSKETKDENVIEDIREDMPEPAE